MSKKITVYVTDESGWKDEHKVDVLTKDVAKTLARDYVDLGEYSQGPIYVQVYTTDDDGDIDQRYDVTVSVDPEVPDCVDGQDHDWQSPYSLVGGLEENPGVYGSNHGGVRVTEVCSHCGAYRITDTGATDYHGQAYTRVYYRDPDDESLEWVNDIPEEE